MLPPDPPLGLIVYAAASRRLRVVRVDGRVVLSDAAAAAAVVPFFRPGPARDGCCLTTVAVLLADAVLSVLTIRRDSAAAAVAAARGGRPARLTGLGFRSGTDIVLAGVGGIAVGWCATTDGAMFSVADGDGDGDVNFAAVGPDRLSVFLDWVTVRPVSVFLTGESNR